MKLALAKRQERDELVKKAQAFNEEATARALKENRGLLALEQETIEKHFKDIDALKVEIDALEKIDTQNDERKTRLEGYERELRTKIHEPRHRPEIENAKDPAYEARTAEQTRAIRAVLLGRDINPVMLRSSQVDNPATGGFLVQPPKFLGELIADVNDETVVGGLIRTIPLTENTELITPRRTSRLTGATRGGEATTPPSATAPAYAERKLRPTKLQVKIAISNQLLRMSSIPAEQMFRDELKYELAAAMEQEFMTGSGASNQPTGIFTAVDTGVPTSRDISTGNTTTAVTADGLWRALYNLKVQYQRRAILLGSRTLSINIRLIKYSTGEYVWAPGLNSNQPDTVCGRPYYQSEFAPSTFTTGLYVGCFFDPMWYWNAILQEMEIQRCIEVNADSDETLFYARLWNDAAPVKPEAFSRIKLA